jgi:sigma-B regulation protein RsbU (phosphoserine phosphatase)
MTSPTRPNDVSILIAEDSRIQARILERRLRESGYHVRVAENGAVAIEEIRRQLPTLVISDIEMPEMNGYELCSAIKGDHDLKAIPFILLSTLSEPEDIIKGLHCGADNYVTKPYDPEYLIARVESLLNTPVSVQEDDDPLEVTLAGSRYVVKSGRQQVLNLLVSTFENAVEKNKELIRTNEELSLAKEKLTLWNQELETLNEQLETANTRMSRDLDAAARVQQSLLPSSMPDTPRVRFAWKYLPCDELAGDFLNLFALDDKHIAVFVVDVSGHGVASSLLSVTIGRLLTPQVSSSAVLVRCQDGTDRTQVTPVAEVAAELNRRFAMEHQNGLYFTMVYGVLNLDTLEFRYVTTGHPPAVHVRRDGKPEPLNGGGTPIGWIADLEFDEEVIQLQPGDRLYLYSDGIPEAMDAELNEFGQQQMLEILELGKSQSLDESVSLLQDAVERWCITNGPKDDVSLLGIEVTSEKPIGAAPH